MKVSDAFPSKYLKASDLQGRQVRVTISHVTYEEIGSDRRPILYFKGKDKGVVMNKTNANNIALMYGDETDDWAGVEVELFMAMVDFQGKSVEAIRIRPLRPARAPALGSGGPVSTAQTSSPPPGHPVDDDIPF